MFFGGHMGGDYPVVLHVELLLIRLVFRARRADVYYVFK